MNNDNTQVIRVRDYTRTPGPRYEDEGDYSGQWFRSTVLEPAFERATSTGQVLTVNLDGTHGFATSFLEEVFGD
ncbi:STAS-like domain-containing protein [Hymenobacter volaticus]|uniref:STAS-like domain-containing protein n=1 Tax=Hymenobacter volaticus TaxID=2932254 RepID=UPI0035C98818